MDTKLKKLDVVEKKMDSFDQDLKKIVAPCRQIK